MSNHRIRILFLPNFAVRILQEDDSSISIANRWVKDRGYWFFRFMKDVDVDVLDNNDPLPFRMISRVSRIELLQALKALVRQSEYDIVVSHSYNSGFVFSLLRSLLGQSKPAHFVVDVGCLNGARGRTLETLIIRFALKSVSGIVYHSSIQEQYYSAHFPRTRRTMVLFGADADFFIPLNEVPTEDYAISIGSTKRDTRLLTEAWRSFEFPLRIVGSRLKSVARPEVIRLLPAVSITNLRQLIHHSAFVILPLENVKYSVGQMTLVQCMLMGKPVIVTDSPGVADYCTDGENCLMVRCGNAQDMRDKIRMLLEDRDTRNWISANARESALAILNERRMSKDIEVFIRETVCNTNSGTRTKEKSSRL